MPFPQPEPEDPVACQVSGKTPFPSKTIRAAPPVAKVPRGRDRVGSP
jgi:hypothetical protein